jgi:hypothetical protein
MIAANPKIERLMIAIGEYEGWYERGSKQFPNGSMSYRNHNPGNLRASPFASSSVDGYAVFRNDFIGWMALHWDLMQKARGNTVTGLGPKSTLRELIYIYAPPKDNNNSEKYLNFVLQKTGFKENTTLGEIFSMD